MVLFLLLTCYRIFKDKRTLSRELANANEEKNQVSTDLKTLQSSFDNTSKAYTKNINELNQHKQVTHVVKMLVESSNPTTKAEKELLQKLKYTVEHSIEGSVDE
ncbi:hypothetical protein [Alkalihalobacillus sp. LMS39]|uniref:hypothetical protein n=1 Tax=Alkalihalobacillus sp. LMS39 TaxID=2924032 RepID=UPI001FB3F876|nr:hypothetical protein [Alkalihalobacillus sp. LMS39]UOE96046.1 hypothetical protein MM271_10795 [Alkalihalobacillus sp. LMS39]